MSRIFSAAELYAHAIAIEREAAERYGEFAERMDDLGNAAVAELFARLAEFEAEHLEALLRRTEGIALPQLAENDYRWLDDGAPETPARELRLLHAGCDAAEVIEALSRRLTNKLLHGPTRALREMEVTCTSTS